ncbi:MAG: hypothetical protein IJ880_06650 [Bacilli bacterium]|nr:hypothetical protein [Bacilli bacterium]
MNENLKRVGKWSYQLRQLAAKGMSEGLVEELRQMGPEAADKVDAFARMSADELKMANRYYEESIQLPGQVADRMTSTYAEQGFSMALGLVKGIDEGKDDILSKMYEVGTESSEGFKQGIDPDAAKEAMEMLGNNSLEAICKILDVNSPSKETEQIGEWTTEGYLIGVKSGIDKVVTLFKSIAEKSIRTLSENLSMSKFVSIGENIARGIEIGLKNGTAMLTNSVSSIASVIMSTFTTRMGIKSPSRVFSEYGNMLALGLCKGLKDSKSKIDDTIEETGEGISAQMAYIMYELGISLEKYNKLLNDDASYYPSITTDEAKNYYANDPNRLAEARFWYNNHMMSDKEYANPTWYLYGGNNAMVDDLSYFRKRYISDLLYGDQGQSYSYFLDHRDELFGNGLVDLSNISSSTLKTSEATNEMSIAFKEFSNRLTDFQREITNLGDRIDGMGVYINGDALVGEIVAPMDARMGRKVISQKRGRM